MTTDPAGGVPPAHGGRQPPRIVMRIMGLMARMAPPDPSGENSRAVRAFRKVETVLDLLKAGPLRRRLRAPFRATVWPVAPGEYRLGAPDGVAAVCALTSTELMAPVAALPGVAIAGRVHTVNLGIERIVLNVISNPAIRAFVMCGKESPVFHPGQGLRALLASGVDGERRIIGAQGHLPVLSTLSHRQIDRFRRQVTLFDHTGVTDPEALAPLIGAAVNAARTAPPLSDPSGGGPVMAAPVFKTLASGGRREPLAYDPKGFFLITLDRAAGEIVCRHYFTDNTPGHEVRARTGERIALALVREGLISQLSHAAYLGAELAKAEAALQLGLAYEQDQRLRATGPP